jgi:histidyl-tRNA synthetase
MAKSSPPPGTSDIFPDEVKIWNLLENTAEKIFPLYGYGEIRTPVFEYTSVFERGIGNETEVVQKEMYTFEDRGGRSLTLRPEGTAGVMRALLNTDVMNGNEKRVFYYGPMFRGERPAAGRKRQFHQIGVENTGRIAPELDAECILMLMHYLKSIGLENSKLLINTRGATRDRPPAEKALKDFFAENTQNLCGDCKERLKRNVWRILDCKQESCAGIVEKAPDVVSFFSDETRAYFKKVLNILDASGMKYKVDPGLVRGLDYYVHTVFEVVHSGLGAQNAVAGGGRYEVFLPGTKKPLIGVGFAAGMERLIMARESLGVQTPDAGKGPVFLVGLNEEARDRNTLLAAELRQEFIPVIAEVEVKSMKAQMRSAHKSGAAFSVIRGEDELEEHTLVCKNMETGEQEKILADKAVDYFKSSVY